MTYEQIVLSNRLEDVVQSYYPLIKSGNIYKSTCVFCSDEDLEEIKKNERETLIVNPRTQVWMCWLCQNGGSVVDFVKMIEPCSFAEALELLENRIKQIRRRKNG